MTKSEAGKLGQAALRAKLGSHYYSHMACLASKGAVAFHKKYRLAPVMTSQYAIVDRLTGKIVGYNPK